MASVLSEVQYTSMEVYTGVYAEYTTCALHSVTSSPLYMVIISYGSFCDHSSHQGTSDI